MTKLSRNAQFLDDVFVAMNRATAAGATAADLARLLGDVVEDLRDLADDRQWPDEAPKTLAEARAQLDGGTP